MAALAVRTNVKTMREVQRALADIVSFLASQNESKGADAIGVYDSGSVFTGTNVRTILEELEARIAALEP